MDDFLCASVVFGERLLAYNASIQGWKTRNCFKDLIQFINNKISKNRVCALHGLRRTGKTTLMRQAIAQMSQEEINHTCFIRLSASDTYDKLKHDIEILVYKHRIKNFFIDEITLLNTQDFPSVITMLSDDYSQLGAKIILAGTDSIMFSLSSEICYGRLYEIRTGEIPFREFSTLLNIDDLDTYIQYGGTLVEEGDDYNINTNDSPYSSSQALKEYVNSAISQNILHGIQKCNPDREFYGLKPLISNNNLEEIVNRVIAYLNAEPIAQSLAMLAKPRGDIKEKQFEKKLSKRPLVQDLNDFLTLYGRDKNDTSGEVDSEEDVSYDIVAEYYKKFSIKNVIRLPQITEEEFGILENFLLVLSVIKRIQHPSIQIIRDLDNNTLMLNGLKRRTEIICVQPGMRYAFTQEIIKTIQEYLRFYNKNEMPNIREILSNSKNVKLGNILESVIFNETLNAAANWNTLEGNNTTPFAVFKQSFYIKEKGSSATEKKNYDKEIDMVVYDPLAEGYRLFEIKHSTKSYENAERHLISPEVAYAIEAQYGKPIVGRTVLYRGDDEFVRTVNGVRVEYRNAEKYLKQLDYEKIQSGIIPPYELSPEQPASVAEEIENTIAYNSENDEQEGRSISKRKGNILDGGL